MSDTKIQLKKVYDTILKHDIPNTKISRYEVHHETVYFYDEQGRMVMMMPEEDWLDILLDHPAQIKE